MRTLCLTMLVCLSGTLPGAGPTVAVLDLSATGVSKDFAIMATDFLRGELHNTGKFTVLERGQVAKVLGEQGLQHSGCTESECAVEIGKLLNARWMLIGSVGRIGANVAVTARIVDVEKGTILYSAKAKASSEGDVDVACEELALKLAARLEGKEIRRTTTIAIEERPVARAPAPRISEWEKAGITREEYVRINREGRSLREYGKWQKHGVSVDEYLRLRKAKGKPGDYADLHRHGATVTDYLRVLEYDLDEDDVVALLKKGKSVGDARKAQIDGWKEDVKRLRASRKGAWFTGLLCTTAAVGGFSAFAYAMHNTRYDEAEDLRQQYLAATDLSEIQRLREETLATADEGHSWFTRSRITGWCALGSGTIASVVGILKVTGNARLKRIEGKLKRAGVKDVSLDARSGGLAVVVRY